MISFDEAKNLIQSCKIALINEKIPSGEGFRRIIAEEIVAPIDLPPFDNSAVDGFLLNSTSAQFSRLEIAFTVQAGSLCKTLILPHGKTAKIMTGAPILQGADAVIMKENVEYQNDLVILKKSVNAKDNIRFRGEDIKKNAVAIRPGSVISSRMIGLLHALGLSEVSVIKPPSVAIISTGDELVFGGSELKFGQVYYLMGPMLTAQCLELGISNITTTIVADDLLSIIKTINQAFYADIILLTGGMSKGDYDLVKQALKHCEVEEIFFEGAWRPGKPLYFGKKNKTIVFGLPGNPNSAFICFHIFVRPFLKQALEPGFHDILGAVPLAQDFVKKPELTVFAMAEFDSQKQLRPLSSQGSHQINSLCKAQALALFPAGDAIVKAGHIVQYYPL